MTPRNIHVVIIGAGLGGLCLAQGLKKHGISFAVYERDPADNGRTQGYRIRIDQTGQRALAACLPPELNLLFLQTCARSRSEGQFLNQQLEPIEGRPSETWRPSIVTVPGGEEANAGDRSANRLTLREILLSGIEDRVHFGTAFDRYEKREDGTVTVLFNNGDIVGADILVGADGVNSSVRRQCFPFSDPEDTGTVCIYGKTGIGRGSNIADVLLSGTSVIFADKFAAIVDTMSFNFPASAARLTAVDDYLYWAIIGRRTDLGSGAEGLQRAKAQTVLQTIARLTSPWASGLRALFAEADVSTVAALPIRSAMKLMPWTPGSVTFLGDAIHAMSPAGGLGANTALGDAAALSAALAKVAASQSPLLDGTAEFENDMRVRANAAIDASNQGARRLFNQALSS